MNEMVLLWVDARLKKSESPPPTELPSYCHLHVTADVRRVTRHMQAVHPHVLVFDFDFPDLVGLQALRRARQEYGGVPVLMLTDQHYENLAVWALRCRVWDYIRKPVRGDLLSARLEALRAGSAEGGPRRARSNLMPAPPVPMEARLIDHETLGNRTHRARAYVDDHLHEKISEAVMADLCQMGRYEFSRLFKHEHGMTFREYLLGARMARATAILRRTSVAITDVAFTVGINDVSHFACLFKRRMGCTPSEYRQRLCSRKGA